MRGIMFTLPNKETLHIDEDVVVDHRELLATENSTHYTKKHISHYYENQPINLVFVFSIKRGINYLLTNNPGVNEYPIYSVEFITDNKTQHRWWFRTEEERDEQYYQLCHPLIHTVDEDLKAPNFTEVKTTLGT